MIGIFMKFYIPLPDGFEFKKINDQDQVVSLHNKLPPIDIQFLIKEYLRNPKKVKVIATPYPEISIYTTLPPKLTMNYMVYEPKNNGKSSADNIQIVDGKKNRTSSQTANSANLFNGHATSWMQNSPLSESKRKQLEEKRDEQRENRRHMGDNPKPT